MPADPELPRADERRGRIRELILRRSFVRVAELSDTFGVSTVTVRSDLEALESAGVVRRIRGGAIPFDALRERPFEEARTGAAAQKARIARAAADQLEPGMSVLLDVGTTTAAIAQELLLRDDLSELTVITNGLAIALALEAAVPRLCVVVTGGTLRPMQHSLVAPLADTVLGRVRADIAFVGCNGVDALAGVTNVNLPEAEVKSAMIAAASRRVVVADGSKIGSVQLGRVAGLDDIDLLITDSDAPRVPLEEIRAAGRLRIVLA